MTSIRCLDMLTAHYIKGTVKIRNTLQCECRHSERIVGTSMSRLDYLYSEAQGART